MKPLKIASLIAWLALLSLSLVAAGYWIHSQILTFEVEDYTITLISSPQEGKIARYTTVNFEAQLKFGTAPVTNGLVYLLLNGTEIGSQYTDSLGKCYFIVTLNDTGFYKFNATYLVSP